MNSNSYDVIILGAGLAGLTLCRHLLLKTNKTILLVDTRFHIPPQHQKVGESTVQLSAYYFSKVLELEEHLFNDQYLKYNLRYYWKTKSGSNSEIENYTQVYLRQLSNIACFQLDRNRIEAHLLETCTASSRVHFRNSASKMEVNLGEGGMPYSHRLMFNVNEEQFDVRSTWVVDTTGRNRMIAKKQKLLLKSKIAHSTSFTWVHGLVDIDRLTDSSSDKIRMRPNRAQLGHFPIWMATNHFMGEGLWFWVIPLRGKTSLGLVYDSSVIDSSLVASAPKLLDWASREFPLFKKDFSNRKILDFGLIKDFAHDCTSTIHPSKWAISGEAGRFADPLYSPGSDFISMYNTWIVDAINTEDPLILKEKTEYYAALMSAMYDSYVPTYADSYNALGDPEVFSMKYTWDLSGYFGFYVFPFINDLFTNLDFLKQFIIRYKKMGLMGANIHKSLAEYMKWKKSRGINETALPQFYELSQINNLRFAESAFYEVGVNSQRALAILDKQLDNMENLENLTISYIKSIVSNQPSQSPYMDLFKCFRST